MLFMKYFKLEPVNLMDILTQSLWLNNNVTTNKELLYWKTLEDQGIAQLKDILNNNNLYLTHEELKNKYNIRTTFLDTLNIQSSIITMQPQQDTMISNPFACNGVSNSDQPSHRPLPT